MAQFDHERLDAYQVAIDFVALANESMLTRLVLRYEEPGTGTGTGTSQK